MHIEDMIKNEELRCSLAATRHLREGEAKRAEAKIAELSAEVGRISRQRRIAVEKWEMLHRRAEWLSENGAGGPFVEEVLGFAGRTLKGIFDAGMDAATDCAPDLVGHVCAACGTRAIRIGDAISCEKCGTGRWISKPAAAAPSDPPVDPANPPLRLNLQQRRMTRCQSDDDGYCDWEHCPQERDGKEAEGRHCPLDLEGSEDTDA